ncbi:3453_t:CDS:2 [Scutellospora calospora]|uniref:3453_t:CDS:1 n=1 Tax=Scutellospora calospora TaxID=85575 RepID=A0ACA9KU37_9GLOM|nr:3453_t:CDS:2 [Scutellospora calospora]
MKDENFLSGNYKGTLAVDLIHETRPNQLKNAKNQHTSIIIIYEAKFGESLMMAYIGRITEDEASEANRAVISIVC